MKANAVVVLASFVVFTGCSREGVPDQVDASGVGEQPLSFASTTYNAAAPLPLGSIKNMTTVDCASIGGPASASCRTFVVSCPGVADLGGMLAITTPATVTRTVVVHGPSGGTKFYDIGSGFVSGYAAAGFRVVQVAWSTAWEAAGAGFPYSITASACRTSTTFDWISKNLANIPTRQPFCVHGSSGGAAALAYAISRYGLKNEVDHATLSFGPVFSRIDYGCAPDTYNGPARDVCPQDPMAFFDYELGTQNSLDNWEGTIGCNTTMPPADVPGWRDDSIMVPGADYSFPHLTTSYFFCTNPANTGAGQASFYIDTTRPLSSTTSCFDDCSLEALSKPDIAVMVADMAQNCVINH